MGDREAAVRGLMLATIQQIEQVGLARVTVRGVAQAAGVNVAAVSYYFGSKDKLVEAALRQTLEHMLSDVDEMVSRLADSPAEVLSELLSYLLEGALAYPNITRAHVHGLYNGDTSTVPLSEHFSQVTRALQRTLMAQVQGLQRDPAQHRAVQALSSAFFPGFFAGFFDPSKALRTPAARRRYVAELTATALRPA